MSVTKDTSHYSIAAGTVIVPVHTCHCLIVYTSRLHQIILFRQGNLLYTFIMWGSERVQENDHKKTKRRYSPTLSAVNRVKLNHTPPYFTFCAFFLSCLYFNPQKSRRDREITFVQLPAYRQLVFCPF